MFRCQCALLATVSTNFVADCSFFLSLFPDFVVHLNSKFTDEVNKAISKGYKILNVYEVWHFDKTSDDLFKGYIRRFMKIKLESSQYDFKTKDEEDTFKSNKKGLILILTNLNTILV